MRKPRRKSYVPNADVDLIGGLLLIIHQSEMKYHTMKQLTRKFLSNFYPSMRTTENRRYASFMSSPEVLQVLS